MMSAVLLAGMAVDVDARGGHHAVNSDAPGVAAA
jgi:hypothetical protein